MTKNFLFVTILITFNALFCMDQDKDKPDTGFEIRQLIWHYRDAFEGKDLRNFMGVDKWNTWVNQYVKKEIEKYTNKDKAFYTLFKDEKTYLRLTIYHETIFDLHCSKHADKQIIFEGYDRPLFGSGDRPFIENNRLLFFGQHKNSIIKYSWNLLGQGQQKCVMSYKDQWYSLIAYKDFHCLMRAILASNKINYIAAKKNQISILEHDLSGVEIPEGFVYESCNSIYLASPFKEKLHYSYQEPIIARYKEETLEQKK